MTWLLWIVVPIVVAYVTWSARRFGPFTVSALFATMNCIAAISVLPLLNPERAADRAHGLVLVYSLIAFCAISVVAEIGIRTGPRGTPWLFHPRGGTVFLLSISALVTVVYFVAVGYSALFLGLQNSVSGGNEDVAGLRLESYAGSRYLFPGYVNQFKNVLMPSFTVLGLIYWSRPGRRRLLLWIVLGGISAFGLLGTGQRGPAVIFAVTTLVFMYLVTNRAISGRTVRFALVVVGLLLMSTLALGRGSVEVDQVEGPFAKTGLLLGQLGDRVTGQGGAGKVAGFRYVYERKNISNGREWAQSFGGLLPGNRGSTLSNEIFADLWGSSRGNTPPSLWSSVYHNFGFFGIAAAPAILALMFGSLTRRREDARRNPNSLTLMGVAGVSVVLGFWTAGSPITPLNTGLVVYAAMWWYGLRIPPRVMEPGNTIVLPKTGATGQNGGAGD